MRLPRLLWWLRPNTFQSDDASAVVFIDRFQLRYREGDRSMLIQQDLQNDPRLVAIERGSMHAWEPPHQREAVSDEKRDQIIENLRRAFATRGYQVMLLDEYLNAPPRKASRSEAQGLPRQRQDQAGGSDAERGSDESRWL